MSEWDMVKCIGLMVLSIKANGKTELQMDKENCFKLLSILKKRNKWVSPVSKELSSGPIDLSMLVNSEKVKSTETES